MGDGRGATLLRRLKWFRIVAIDGPRRRAWTYTNLIVDSLNPHVSKAVLRMLAKFV